MAPDLWEARRPLRLVVGDIGARMTVIRLARGELWLHSPDLAFNVRPDGRNRARIFHWLMGAVGRFGPHRFARSMIRDPAAARRALDRILAWDFERILVSHGEVFEGAKRDDVARAFSFLG